MPGESFFMAFGGLGLSLAGFAGLIAALDRSAPTRSAITGYRIRNIVTLGFWLMFTGLGTVAVYAISGSNLTLAIRFGTMLLTLAFLKGLLIDTRPGPAWPSERERRVPLLIAVSMICVTAPNLVVVKLGYLQGFMIVGLIGPVSIFYNTIRAATAPDQPGTEQDSSTR
jgi:predicted membrane metal-binding protein